MQYRRAQSCVQSVCHPVWGKRKEGKCCGCQVVSSASFLLLNSAQLSMLPVCCVGRASRVTGARSALSVCLPCIYCFPRAICLGWTRGKTLLGYKKNKPFWNYFTFSSDIVFCPPTHLIFLTHYDSSGYCLRTRSNFTSGAILAQVSWRFSLTSQHFCLLQYTEFSAAITALVYVAFGKVQASGARKFGKLHNCLWWGGSS